MKVKIENLAGDQTIFLYGDIDAFEGNGIKDFVSQLSNLNEDEDLHVRINSHGGSVSDGINMFNLLLEHPGKVIMHIDGNAFSIASVIALAGDEIHMADNALFMIHNPSGGAYGEQRDLEFVAKLLEKIKDQIMDIYEKKNSRSKNKLSRDVISKMMDDITVLDANEAKDLGFVDVVTETLKMVASADGQKVFYNLPGNYVRKHSNKGEGNMSTDVENKVDEDQIDSDSEDTSNVDKQAANSSDDADVQNNAGDNASDASVVNDFNKDVKAYASEVKNLCGLANREDLALTFIENASSIDDVKAKLIELNAKKDDDLDISNSHHVEDKSDNEKPVVDTSKIYAMHNEDIV